MPDSEWLRPLKLREYYVDSAVRTVEDAERQLWVAVILGDVRARSGGVEYGPEWRKQLAYMTFDKDNPFALPPDIELSVEDARRKWGT